MEKSPRSTPDRRAKSSPADLTPISVTRNLGPHWPQPPGARLASSPSDSSSPARALASPPPVKSPQRWDGSRATQPTRLNTSHRGRRTCQCRKQPLHSQGSPLRLRLRAGREGVGRGHPGPGVGDGVDPLRSIPSRSQIRPFPARAKSRLPRDAPFQQECVLQ